MKKRILNCVLTVMVAAGMLIGPAVNSFAVNDEPSQDAVKPAAEDRIDETEKSEKAEQPSKEDSLTKEDGGDSSAGGTAVKEKNKSGSEEVEKTSDGDMIPTTETNPAKKNARFRAAEGSNATQTGPVGIGDKRYAKLQDAVDEAEEGQTIKLYGNITEKVTVDKDDLKLDMNGYTITAKGGINKNAVILSGDNDFTIANGTIKGGTNTSGNDGVVQVAKESSLEIIGVTFKENRDTVITNYGKLVVTDSKFIENSHVSTQISPYIITNKGDGAVAEFKRTIFNDNKRVKGGIISSTSRSKAELSECDIKYNSVGSDGSVYISGYSQLVLDNTTVTGNKSSGYTAGLKLYDCYLDWKNSAVYENETTSNSYFSDDFYISDKTDLISGSIPLAKDMKDHGKALTEYQLVSNYKSIVAEAPLSKNYLPDRQWSVELKNSDGGVAEYNSVVYDSIKEAVEAAKEDKNAVIRLVKDIDRCSEKITGQEGLVIDMEGYNIKSKNSRSSALVVEGEEITIRNGTFNGTQSTSNSNPALYLTCDKVTLDNVDFNNNYGSGIRAYAFNQSNKTAVRRTILLKECNFTGNGKNSDSNVYSFESIGFETTLTNCHFDDNARGIRLCETATDCGLNMVFTVKECTITKSDKEALNILISKDHSAKIIDCEIKNNKGTDSAGSVITLKNAGYGGTGNGGQKLFENCVISDNESDKYTIMSEAGDLLMNECLIERNTATNAGGIYVGLYSALFIKDTVIKNNTATGASYTNSGGIALYSAKVILITPIVNGMGGGQEDLGFHNSGFIMIGGALYNNKTMMTSPSGDDLYVSRNCTISVPKVKEMVDGDHDFSGMEWKDDNKEETEESPANKVNAPRYYSAGAKPHLKQVYINGENGNDAGSGKKADPVKTLARAKALAMKNDTDTIMVLGKISLSEIPAVSNKDDKNYAAKDSGIHKASNVGSDQKKKYVIDLNGKRVIRDTDYTGVIFDLAGNNKEKITVKNTIVDGSSERSVRADGQLIHVKDADLVMEDGAVLRNNGKHPYGVANSGGIFVEDSNLTFNEGARITNIYGCKGGGIQLSGSTMVMNGGSIDNNCSLFHYDNEHIQNGVKYPAYEDSYGGGVLAINGSKMTMNGGTISQNSSLTSGGGVALGTIRSNTVSHGKGNYFEMNGGSLDENKAYLAGGGLFVQIDCKAKITAGSISNNLAQGSTGDSNYGTNEVAEFAGGGIYVNGYHDLEGHENFGLKTTSGILELSDVEIGNNTAEYEGGAIGFCGFGAGSIGTMQGSAIHDNESLGKGTKMHKAYTGKDGWDENTDIIVDNVLFRYDHQGGVWNDVYETEELLNTSSISEFMLSGGEYEWFDVNGDKLDSSELRTVNKLTRVKTNVTASDPEMAKSIARAKVHINGNTSKRNAGGIGSNGRMGVGATSPLIDIPFEKKWDDEGKEKNRITSVKIDLLRNGDVVSSKIIKADDKGIWRGVFKDMEEYPLNGEGGVDYKNPYEYTVREDMDYKPAKGLKTGDLYTVEEAYNEENESWVLTNTAKDISFPTTAVIKAEKTLDNKAPIGSDYTFELYNEEGKLIDSVKNEGGEITFAPLEFSKAGEYIYRIKEKAGDNEGIKYDEGEFTATVKVEKDGFDLKSEISYKEKDIDLGSEVLPIFRNETIPPDVPTVGNPPETEEPDTPKRPNDPPVTKKDKPNNRIVTKDSKKVKKNVGPSMIKYSDTGDDSGIDMAAVVYALSGFCVIVLTAGAIRRRRQK